MNDLRRHVVLVGLPGAGKSTVGPLLARQLSMPFVDLDAEIERTAGRSIGHLFGVEGEPAFRALERSAMDRALQAQPAVIAAGGGWAAEAGNLESAGDRALVLYLYIDPEAAAGRLSRGPPRPLLGADPLPALRELLAARGPFYERAAIRIDAGNESPASVARRAAALAQEAGVW